MDQSVNGAIPFPHDAMALAQKEEEKMEIGWPKMYVNVHAATRRDVKCGNNTQIGAVL